MAIKLSELLRLGKHVQDVPQAIWDPEKTDGKFNELKGLALEVGGLADDISSVKANPLGVSLATSAGALLETLREYAGTEIVFDIYDEEGQPVFPTTHAEPPPQP